MTPLLYPVGPRWLGWAPILSHISSHSQQRGEERFSQSKWRSSNLPLPASFHLGIALMLSPEHLQGRGEGGRLNAEAVFAPQGFWEASVYGHRRRGRSLLSLPPTFHPIPPL